MFTTAHPKVAQEQLRVTTNMELAEGNFVVKQTDRISAEPTLL